MSRLLPHPILSLGLVLMWLLLNRFSLGHLLLGSAVAIVAGQAMAALQPERPHIRRWDRVAVLLFRVTIDIVRSNVAVASILLGLRVEVGVRGLSRSTSTCATRRPSPPSRSS